MKKHFFLKEIETGRIVQTVEGGFEDFIKNEWGGWFPFERDGYLHCASGQIRGCEDYSKYWTDKEN
jgi:hypothetical protein